MSQFDIQLVWLSNKGARDELGSTLSRLTILIANQVVTEFQSHQEVSAEHVEVPAYGVAEWIARNWWPLLWEPRKTEDTGDGPDFLSRHSILAAQQGFALPDVILVPNGRNVAVSARPRYAPFADVRFRQGANALLPRSALEEVLRSFNSKVRDRLADSGIVDTEFQHEWNLIENTEAGEQTLFCKFVGALGLSPYVENPRIFSIIEKTFSTLGEQVTMDLCLASDQGNLRSAADEAFKAIDLTSSVTPSTLSPLQNIQPVSDRITVPAWRLGVEAASRIRRALKIGGADPHGGNKVFELLRVDPGIHITDDNMLSDEVAPVVGALVREGEEVRIATLQRSPSRRRFAAARGVYSAWASEKSGGRLLTLAVTREQQASRAFAAELMAPIDYLRSKATRRRLSHDEVYDLAGRLDIGADVVRKQALNNGLQITKA